MQWSSGAGGICCRCYLTARAQTAGFATAEACGAPVGSRAVSSRAAASTPPVRAQERILVDGQLEHTSLRPPRVHTPADKAGSNSAYSINFGSTQRGSSHAAANTSGRTTGSGSASGILPLVPPMTDQQMALLLDALHSSRNTLVVTGAGVSTESGIPDYRGRNGAYTTGFQPMTHQQFMASPASRARYWARSAAGWATFSSSRPSGAHEGLARLQAHGWVGHIITQNVDRLHQAAGSPAERVLELHGSTHEVRCMKCSYRTRRRDFQQTLKQLNPNSPVAVAADVVASSAPTAATVSSTTQDPTKQEPMRRPDGDVELQDSGGSFVVPPCPACGDGILKPDVVFFGDSLPSERSYRASQLAKACSLFLAVGTSLSTMSAFRLADHAKSAGAKILLLNCGPTRADPLAHAKVEVLAGEALLRLAADTSLLVPRILSG